MATGRDTGCNEPTKPSDQREEHKQERLLRVSCQRRPNASPVSLCVSQLRAWYFCPWLRALLHFPLLPLLLSATPLPPPTTILGLRHGSQRTANLSPSMEEHEMTHSGGRRGQASTRTERRETTRSPELNWIYLLNVWMFFTNGGWWTSCDGLVRFSHCKPRNTAGSQFCPHLDQTIGTNKPSIKN